MRGRNLNLIAFVIICIAITYYDIRKCKRMPWPPRFIFAGIAFGFMELVSLFDETLSGVTAIGFVIATFLKEGFVATCDEMQGTGHPQVVDFMSGTTNQPPSVGSITEYQQATTQQQSTGIPGPAPALPPGTTVV
jgi:hypothetical protein